MDVEDRDDSVWHNLSPFDGGLSGWRLLWDRYCPIPSWRYGLKLPRYQQVSFAPVLQGLRDRSSLLGICSQAELAPSAGLCEATLLCLALRLGCTPLKAMMPSCSVPACKLFHGPNSTAVLV